MSARHRRRSRNPVPLEYRPGFPWWIYLVFGVVVFGPVLVALILEITG